MSTDDVILLTHAAQAGYILITGDRDFEKLHYAWLAEGKRHSGIVYISPRYRQHIGLILEHLEIISGAGTSEDMYNVFWRVE